MGKYIKHCKYCEKEFSGNKDALFCSPACWTKYRKPPDHAIPRSFRGKYSELMVSIDLIGKGYMVFYPLLPFGPYDIIALKDQKLIKIEVKTSRLDRDNKMNKPKHNHKEHDIMALYILDINKIVYIPDLG